MLDGRSQLLHRRCGFFQRAGLFFGTRRKIERAGRDLRRRHGDGIGARAHLADNRTQTVAHGLDRIQHAVGIVIFGDDVHRQIAAGNPARDIGRVRRFAAELTRDAARDQQTERDAGEHAAQNQADHQNAAAVIQIGGFLGSRLGAVFLDLGHLVEQGIERIRIGARFVQLVGQFLRALMHVFRLGQIQRRLHQRFIVFGERAVFVQQCLGLFAAEQRARRFQVGGHVGQIFHGALARRLALLGGGGQQESAARTAGADQRDVGFLDIRQTDQIAVIHAIGHRVHFAHVDDADAGDDRAYNRNQQESRRQLGPHFHFFEHFYPPALWPIHDMSSINGARQAHRARLQFVRQS